MDPVAAPLGELIASIGLSVAGAQQTIDGRIIEHFGAIYDRNVAAFEPLRAIGYQPTWYQIAEASAKVTLVLTVTRSQSDASASPQDVHGLRAAPVDAGYQSRFAYGRTLSSSLSFRIVPVPPPARAGA